jgi:ferrous iron transport protein A
MSDHPITSDRTIALGEAPVGFRGRILALDVDRAQGAGLPGHELERRLIELGFVEGADVELLHQGLFGGDPIAVRVAASTIALRRREAMAVVASSGGSIP